MTTAHPRTATTGPSADPRSGTAVAVGASLLIALSGALPALMIGALGVQIREALNLDAAALGSSVSVWSTAAALAAVWMGGLADRIGWQRSMLLSASLATVALVGIGAVATSWGLLAVAMAIGGVAHTMALTSGNLAILSSVPPRRRAFVLGARQSAVPGAGLLAGLSVPLIATRAGWRWSYALAVLAPVAVIVMVLRSRSTDRADVTARLPFRIARPDAPFAVFAIVSILGAALVNSVNTFTVSSLVEAGYSEAASGALFMVGAFLAITSRVIVGQVTDRRRSRGFGPITAMLLAGIPGFLLLSTGSRFHALIGLVLAFGAATGWLGLTHFVVISHNPGQPGGASGLILTTGFLGGAVGPVIFGAIVDRAGFSAAWTACAVAAFLAACAAVVAGRLYRDRSTSPAKL